MYFTANLKLSIKKEDPDADKFLECVVALDCKIIVSGDKHLKGLKQYIDIAIYSPRQFIDKLNDGLDRTD